MPDADNVVDLSQRVSVNGYDRNLQEELEAAAAIKKALEEEFSKDIDPNNPDNAANARKQLLMLVPDAGMTIRWLMIHGDSESVRANLAKYVFSEAMRDALKKGDASDLDRILADLSKS